MGMVEDEGMIHVAAGTNQGTLFDWHLLVWSQDIYWVICNNNTDNKNEDMYQFIIYVNVLITFASHYICRSRGSEDTSFPGALQGFNFIIKLFSQ